MKVRQRENGRPDCRVDIGLPKPLMLEIYSPTGQGFAFKGLLDNVTRQFQQIVNEVEPGSGGQLRITYHEWSEKTPYGMDKRIPSVVKDAAVHSEVIAAIKQFWQSGKDKERLSIPNLLFATFERTSFNLPWLLNYQCQIPATPQSVINTFSQTAVKKAARQLGPFKEDHCTGLVVCDGGNELISKPRRYQAGMNFDRADIFNHIVRESDIDFLVCVGRVDKMRMDGLVMSPHSKRPELSVETFFNPALGQDVAAAIQNAVEKALELLPVPRIHLYQSKHRQDQKAAGGWRGRSYKGWQMTSNPTRMALSFSARAVLELLTSKMTVEEFRAKQMHRGPCDFAQWAITNISLVPDDSADDDHVVVTLSKDPEAMTFSEMANHITKNPKI